MCVCTKIHLFAGVIFADASRIEVLLVKQNKILWCVAAMSSLNEHGRTFDAGPAVAAARTHWSLQHLYTLMHTAVRMRAPSG